MTALPAPRVVFASPSSPSPFPPSPAATKPANASFAPPSRPVRPSFNSHLTSDRLRVSSTSFVPPVIMPSRIPKDRRSIFRELGLDDETATATSSFPTSPTSFDAEPLVGPAISGAGAVSAGSTSPTTTSTSGANATAMSPKPSLSLRSRRRNFSTSTTPGAKTVEFELPPPPLPPPSTLPQSPVSPTPGAVPRATTGLSSWKESSTLGTTATNSSPGLKAGGVRRWWQLGGINSSTTTTTSGSGSSSSGTKHKRPSLKTASIFVLEAMSGPKRRAEATNPNSSVSSRSSGGLARSMSTSSTASRGGKKLRKRRTEFQMETPVTRDQRPAHSELGSEFPTSIPPG